MKNSASYIHTYGGGALATVGSAATTWMGLGLRFLLRALQRVDRASRADCTPPPPYASLGLDKPCVVEEFTTADVSFGLERHRGVVCRVVAEHHLRPRLRRGDRLGLARHRRAMVELPACLHRVGRGPFERRRAMS